MAGSVQQFLWSLLVFATLSHADDSDNKTQNNLNSITSVDQPLQSSQIVNKHHGIEVRPPYPTPKKNPTEYPLGLQRFLKPGLPGAPNFDPLNLRRSAPYPVPGSMGITPNLPGLFSTFNLPNPTDIPGPPIQPGFPGLMGAFGPNLHPGVSTHRPTLQRPSNFNPPYPTPVSGPPPWYRGPMAFGPNLHPISSIRPNLPGQLNFNPPVPGSSMQPRYRGPTGAFGIYPPLKFLDALATIRGVPLNMNPPRLPPRYQTFRTFGPYLPELSKGFRPNLSPVATLPPFHPGYHPYTKSFRRIPPLERFNPSYNLPSTTQSSQSTVVKEPTAPSISLKSLNIGPLAPPKNMKMDKINKFMQYPDDTWQAAQLDAIASPPAPGDLQALLPPYLRVKTRERHDTQDTRDTLDIQEIQDRQDREDQPERLEDVGYMDGMETRGAGDGFGVPVYSEEYVVTVTRATSPASQELPLIRGLRQGPTAPPSPPALLSDSAAAYDETFLYGEGIFDEPRGRWLLVTEGDATANQFLQ